MITVFSKYIEFKEKLLEIPIRVANMLKTVRAYAKPIDELMLMYQELFKATCYINWNLNYMVF